MLSAKDFYKPSKYNLDTKNQLWCSVIADTHDSICCCNWPFAHLLANLFPPGHKDRKLTIDQILDRDYKELCHSTTGEEETAGGDPDIHGDAEEENTQEEEKEEGYIEDKDLTELLAAAIKEEER